MLPKAVINSKYLKKKWFILIFYCVITFLCSISNSLQAPFYPIVSEKKGVSPSQYGIVFGVFSLSLFAFSFISGMLIGKFGAVKISLIGLLIIGIANIAFGFVDRFNASSLFIGTSVIIRIFEGMGFAMSRNAAISIVSYEFSDNVEMAFAALQTFTSVGYQIGPVAGGALFELGGFLLPFLVTGVLLLCAAFVASFLPKDFAKEEKMCIKQMLDLLKIANVIEGILTVFGSFTIITFVTATYEPHLKGLDLSPLQIGLVFFSMAFASSFSSFGWSTLCKAYDNSEYIRFLIVCIIICGLILVGPAPYLPVNLTVISAVTAVIILGIGSGGGKIIGFSIINKGSQSVNLSQNKEVHGIVATIYTVSLSLGSFTGPTLGGYLFDIFGFAWSSHFLILYEVVFVLSIIIYRCFRQDKKEPEESLMESYLNGKIMTYKSVE